MLKKRDTFFLIMMFSVSSILVFSLLLFCMSAIFPVRALCDGLDTWYWRNPLPTGNTLNKVTYVNSTFVAAGYHGTILTSPNGVTWKTRASGTSNYLSGVAYGNSTFVVMGGEWDNPYLVGRSGVENQDFGYG